MIKLRLKRYGRKRQPSYRIVAANSRARRDGRPIEELGFYNPRTDETTLNVPAIVRHLQQGAQPTDTVRQILKKARVFDRIGSDGTYIPLPVEETIAPPVESAEVPDRAENEIAAAETDGSDVSPEVEAIATAEGAENLVAVGDAAVDADAEAADKEEAIAPSPTAESTPETPGSEPAEPAIETVAVVEAPAIAETTTEKDENSVATEDKSLGAALEEPSESTSEESTSEPGALVENGESLENSNNPVSAESDASTQEG